MLRVLSAMLLLCIFTGRADYIFHSYPDSETSLPRLEEAGEVEVLTETGPAGQVQYSIEIDAGSPFMGKKSFLNAYLILTDAGGAKLAEVPLGYLPQSTSEKKKKPYFRIHFSIKEELQKASYLQVGSNNGFRQIYRKVWLVTQPAPEAK